MLVIACLSKGVTEALGYFAFDRCNCDEDTFVSFAENDVGNITT